MIAHASLMMSRSTWGETTKREEAQDTALTSTRRDGGTVLQDTAPQGIFNRRCVVEQAQPPSNFVPRSVQNAHQVTQAQGVREQPVEFKHPEEKYPEVQGPDGVWHAEGEQEPAWNPTPSSSAAQTRPSLEPAAGDDEVEEAVQDFFDDVQEALARLERGQRRARERYDNEYINIHKFVEILDENNSRYLSVVAKAHNALMHALIGNKPQTPRKRPDSYNEKEYKALHYYIMEESDRKAYGYKPSTVQDLIYDWMDRRAKYTTMYELVENWPFSEDRIIDYLHMAEHLGFTNVDFTPTSTPRPSNYTEEEYKTLHYFILCVNPSAKPSQAQESIYSWMERRAHYRVAQVVTTWQFGAPFLDEYIHLALKRGWIMEDLEDDSGSDSESSDSSGAGEGAFRSVSSYEDFLETKTAPRTRPRHFTAPVPGDFVRPGPDSMPQLLWAPSRPQEAKPASPRPHADDVERKTGDTEDMPEMVPAEGDPLRKAVENEVKKLAVPSFIARPKVADEARSEILYPYDGFSGWVVCRWPLWDGTHKVQHTFVDGKTVHVQTAFKSDDKRVNVSAHGNFPLWGGVTQPCRAEGKGLFILIKGDNPDTPYHEGNMIVTLQDRLRTSLMSTLYKHQLCGMGEKERMISMAKNHYLRWNINRPDLEEELMVEYEQEWFQDELDAVQEAITNGWLQRARRRAQAYCGARGRDYEQEFYDWRSDPLTRFMRRVKSFFTAGRYDNESEVEFLRQFKMETLELGLVPCSKAWINKQAFPSDRELPPITNPLNELRIHQVVDSTPAIIESFGLLPKVPMVYPLNDQSNLEAALRIRMLGTPEPELEESLEYMRYGMRFIDLMDEVILDDTFDNLSFLTQKYGAKKGARLADIANKPITKMSLVSELFVKGEAYRGKDADTYKPRQIWNNSEDLIAAFSGYTKQIGDKLATMFDLTGDDTYLCKTPPYDVGQRYLRQLTTRQNTKAFDGTNYDGSLTIVDRFLELYLFVTKVRNMPDSWGYVEENWFGLRGVSKDGMLEVMLEAARESGWLLTSPFNSLDNIIKIRYSLSKLGATEILTMVLGDDGMASYNGDIDEDELKAIYLRLGMVLDIVSSEPGRHTMCSGHFWPVNGTVKWGSSPFKLMAGLGLNHHNHGPHLHLQLLHGTAKSLLPVAGHVPVIGVLLRVIQAQCEEFGIAVRHDNRHMYQDRIQGGQVDYPDDDTYQFFADVYGFSVDAVLAIEAAIVRDFNVMQCPYALDADWFGNGYAVDVGDKGSSCDNMFFERRETIGTQEEREKLRGVTSFPQAVHAGWKFGLEEDQAISDTRRVNCYLHALFSAIAYIHFDAGVVAHDGYNDYVRKRMEADPHCGLIFAKKRQPRKPKRVRGIPRIRGRGDYWTDGMNLAKRVGRLAYDEAKKAIPKGSFAKFGESVGGNFGPLAASLGRHAGNMISNLVGMGGYTEIRKNTLIRPADMGEVIATFGSGRDYVRVRHREYMGDITAAGGTAFTVTSFLINPGLPSVFPWGSIVSSAFDQYILVGMAVEYISLFSDITSGGPLGAVVMGSDYNDLASNFGSKQVMENAQFSVSGKPSNSLIHYFECDPTMTQSSIKNIRVGPVTGDLRLYDLCNFQLATVGLPVSTGVLGELWATFDVLLLKPSLSNYITTLMDHFQLPTSVSTAHYLSADTTTVVSPVASSSLGGRVTNSTYTFPATVRIGDIYEFKYDMVGASTVLTNAIGYIFAGCTTVNLYGADTVSYLSLVAGATHVAQISSQMVRITSNTASISITSGTLPGTLTGGDLFVTRMGIIT